MSLETGTPTRLVSIPLSEAPEGESELVLTVRDEVSGRTLEAREPFRVREVTPAAADARRPRSAAIGNRRRGRVGRERRR